MPAEQEIALDSVPIGAIARIRFYRSGRRLLTVKGGPFRHLGRAWYIKATDSAWSALLPTVEKWGAAVAEQDRMLAEHSEDHILGDRDLCKAIALLVVRESNLRTRLQAKGAQCYRLDPFPGARAVVLPSIVHVEVACEP